MPKNTNKIAKFLVVTIKSNISLTSNTQTFLLPRKIDIKDIIRYLKYLYSEHNKFISSYYTYECKNRCYTFKHFNNYIYNNFKRKDILIISKDLFNHIKKNIDPNYSNFSYKELYKEELLKNIL